LHASLSSVVFLLVKDSSFFVCARMNMVPVLFERWDARSKKKCCDDMSRQAVRNRSFFCWLGVTRAEGDEEVKRKGKEKRRWSECSMDN